MNLFYIFYHLVFFYFLNVKLFKLIIMLFYSYLLKLFFFVSKINREVFLYKIIFEYILIMNIGIVNYFIKYLI